MRIAVVTTSYPARDGDPAGHFVHAEVRELERAGHAVTVLAPTAGGAFGWPGAAARLRARPDRAWDAARWIARAARSLAAARPDRVVAHWAIPSAWPIAARAGELRQRGGTRSAARGEADTALEVVSHGADVRLLAALPGAARARLVAALAARAEVWRFASGALLETLSRVLDRSAAASLARVARVAAPPFELPDVREAARALRAEAGPVLVSVGRLVPSKRVHLAIDHARRLGARLVVVGDGPERARLERQARGADVRFVGAVPRPQALAWIAAADALLFASRAEGLSTVVREAQALGVRVHTLAHAV